MSLTTRGRVCSRLATALVACLFAATAQAQDIACDAPRGVRFNNQVHETSSQFTIVCANLRSRNPTITLPPWVTLVNIGPDPFNEGRFLAELSVQANPNVFPRAGTIRIADSGRPTFFRGVHQGGALSVTNSADFFPDIGLDSLATAFGGNMAAVVQSAPALPLPTELAGTRVVLAGGPQGNVERPLELLYISPAQVNFHIPRDVQPTIRSNYYIGVINTNGETNISVTEVAIKSRAPALFSAASSNPQPPPAMYVLRVDNATGVQTTEYPTLDEQGNQLPIEVNRPNETVFFVLYGTGMFNASAARTTAMFGPFGDPTLPVQFLGDAPGFIGLQQINLLIPPSMAGRGRQFLRLFVDSAELTDAVYVNFK